MKDENRINGRDMDDRLYKLLSFWRNHHFDCIHSFPPLIFILLVCLYLKYRHTKWIEWRHSNVKGSPTPHDQYLATSLASTEIKTSSALLRVQLEGAWHLIVEQILFSPYFHNCLSLEERIWIGASLAAQWLRVCLPMQGTRVRALVWEDPTCRGATRPVSHSYWACASGACAPQREMVRGPRTAMRSGPRLPQLEKALAQKQRPNTDIN